MKAADPLLDSVIYDLHAESFFNLIGAADCIRQKSIALAPHVTRPYFPQQMEVETESRNWVHSFQGLYTIY